MRMMLIISLMTMLAIVLFIGCSDPDPNPVPEWQLSEIESILFPTDNTGMATDIDGTLWVTTNGGGNWQSKSYPRGGLTYSGPGWLLFCGGDSLLYSTDNGDHWNVYDSLDGHIPFIHVRFIDYDNGFVFNTAVEETVIGTYPHCYSEYRQFLTIRRIIGGVVQTSIDTSIEMYFYDEDDAEDIRIISFMGSWSFGDTILGICRAYAEYDASDFFLIRSIGSGSPWEIDTSGLSVSITSSYDICFYSSSCGLFVSENGLCQQTLDGGVTWSTITTPAGGNDLFDIDIRDNKAIAVGEDGTIIESNNFTVTGISWHEIESGTDSDINAVSITPGGDVWVGGLDGLKKLE